MISTEILNDDLKRHPILRHFPTLLKKWKGKQARLCDLTTSHRSISIKISENCHVDNLPCLFICCLEPTSMNGRFDMEFADIEVKTEGDVYIVYDKHSCFELVCQGIEIKEMG